MAYTTIDDPSAYFHTQLYTGNGTAIGSGGNAITNNANSGNFKPDWTWHKVRSTANDHQVYDSSRGVKIRLNTNATNSDFTLNEGLQSFDTNGFTVGSDNGVNQNSQTFVAWQWKANGGTTSSNSSGTNITSTVQANTTAGFSIVTFTGTGNDGDSYGHGLTSAPELVIPKKRSGTSNWQGYAFDGGNSQYFYLNLGNAFTSTSGNSAASSSSVITTDGSGDSNPNGGTVVSYCFHSVQGYSKIGRYKGNGSSTVTQGPFIYTGFKPAWTMIKRVDAASDGWYIHDSTRSPSNVIDKAFRANVNNAESGENIDYLSNGFAIRIGANNNFNNASGTYFYMAFAEHPFVSSKGVPTTAR